MQLIAETLMALMFTVFIPGIVLAGWFGWIII